MTSRNSIVLQIGTGLLVFWFAQWMGGVREVDPFYTYLYLFSWYPFLFILDRVQKFRSGQSPLGRPRWLLNTAVLSVTVWLLFEVINFRLKNWLYIGLPSQTWIRWPGYALSFATVIPGILLLANILESILKKDPLPEDAFPVNTPSLLWVGIIMLALPLIWPRYLFPLVWGFLFFALEPYVQKSGGHSLVHDWQMGRWKKTTALLLSGFLCGLFWETCNFHAAAKWIYTIPFVGNWKLFEMPVLGFLGFPAFALEVFVAYQAAKAFWKSSGPIFRRVIVTAALIFWMVAFRGIDLFTVLIWR